jgi:hypothetical protein
MHLLRRFSRIGMALFVASVGVALMPVESAQAAPTWCRAWQIGGQSWILDQSNRHTVLFAVRMVPGSPSFSGFARFNRGDVWRGGVPSQFVRGAVTSEGVGRVMIDVQWSVGLRGQYHGTAVQIRRTANGGLTAGLQGTAVELTRGVAVRWMAVGQSSGQATSGGRSFWPLFCAPRDVVRYPA